MEVGSGDDFYRAPEPLPPGEHGDLVRYQEVADPPAGVTWWRVMYLSETVSGGPTVVTGVVTVPKATAPDGGWPLVTHAHGSTGIGDTCSPSVSLDGDRAAAIEVQLLSSTAPAKGYVVASTDYEGLGGPGVHPFLVGVSEGRSVLDIARAARQLPAVGADIGPRTAIAGYSQGGHAALWANELAADWTPDLDIVGTMAGAPASEVPDVVGSLPAELRDQGEALLAAGFAAAYPDVDLDAVLTPAGRAWAGEDDAGCAAPSEAPAGPLTKRRLADTDPWPKLLADNIAGTKAAKAPLLIIHSAQDHNVPIAASATLLDRLCAAGQVVERRVLPTGDHVATAVPAYDQAFDWFTGLAEGTKPVSSC